MLTSRDIEDAAARLLENRHRLRDAPCGPLLNPLPAIEQLLPVHLLPQDDAEAYAIQDALIGRLGAVGGWKVAGSGPAGPSCAPVFEQVLHTGAGPLPWTVPAATEFECEIGFEIARDMPGRERTYDAPEVAAAIRSTRITIEFLAPRFTAGGTPLDRWVGIADGQSCGALAVGGAVGNGFIDVDCAQQPVRIEADGMEIHRAIGGNALPRLLSLLVWLANHLGRRGLPLRAGQIVTTGSCTGKRPWSDARRMRVQFEGVGEFEARRPA